uniref:Ig-like domain-containing protein n=1 Tax=Cyprinus carpio carpio TaxID=630221 RepID=A0A9J7ZB76_CYPCA
MFRTKTFVFSWLCFCHLVGVFADADEVKSVSVKEGDSVTLNTSLTEIQKDDQVLWKFGLNRSVIAKISQEAGIFNTYDGPDERFRDRLQLDNQTGSLTITNTRTTDSGLYEVSIKNSSSEAKNRFNVTIYRTVSSSSSHPPDSVSLTVLTSAAAAAAVGSLLIGAAVGIFCIYKKYRKTDQEDQTVQTRTEEITYSVPKFYKSSAQKAEVKQEDEAMYARVARNADQTRQ